MTRGLSFLLPFLFFGYVRLNKSFWFRFHECKILLIITSSGSCITRMCCFKSPKNRSVTSGKCPYWVSHFSFYSPATSSPPTWSFARNSRAKSTPTSIVSATSTTTGRSSNRRPRSNKMPLLLLPLVQLAANTIDPHLLPTRLRLRL